MTGTCTLEAKLTLQPNSLINHSVAAASSNGPGSVCTVRGPCHVISSWQSAPSYLAIAPGLSATQPTWKRSLVLKNKSIITANCRTTSFTTSRFTWLSSSPCVHPRACQPWTLRVMQSCYQRIWGIGLNSSTEL